MVRGTIQHKRSAITFEKNTIQQFSLKLLVNRKRNSSFTLVLQPVLEKENSEFKHVKLRSELILKGVLLV